MTAGIVPYDLAAEFCEECGRHKSARLFFDGFGVQDCQTCMDVVTRHRCTGRPDIGEVPDGQSWECEDCGSTWTPRSALEHCEDCCGDCGHQVTVRSWACLPGPRLSTAPRYRLPVYTPLRGAVGETISIAMARPRYSPYLSLISRPRSEPQPPGSCYRMRNGCMVHVRPGCRC